MLGLLMLTGAGVLLLLERQWTPQARLSPQEAFLHGDIGLEIAPLKYLLVMDDPRLGGSAFSDGKDDAPSGSWVRKFGFIPRPDTKTGAPACLESGLAALPVGSRSAANCPARARRFR
ncbi:MAG: hypothetical protein HC850_00495 [Rhodomicrobium sp.]|nr:hypothetical protein [Rhodomicrobium sp.]